MLPKPLSAPPSALILGQFLRIPAVGAPPMTSDDLRRIFMGPTLFRLDTILSPRLVPVLYVSGLATLLLWAVTHLFDSFARNFGDGLWGLLEIVVYGAFGLMALRVACEALLVW